jgi:hypothetical protein
MTLVVIKVGRRDATDRRGAEPVCEVVAVRDGRVRGGVCLADARAVQIVPIGIRVAQRTIDQRDLFNELIVATEQVGRRRIRPVLQMNLLQTIADQIV